MINIAIGVALGIVLAVIILRYWRVMLAGSAAIIAILIGVAIILLAGYWVYSNGNSIGNSIAYGLCGIAIALPMMWVITITHNKVVVTFPKTYNFVSRHDFIRLFLWGIIVLSVYVGVLLTYGFLTS